MAALTTAPEKTAEEKTTVPVKAEERRLRFLDFDLFEDLRDEMARLWGQRPLVGRPAPRPLASFAEGKWAPRMDVFEKNGNLVIKAELPGVKKEDIRVEIEEGDLIVHGERKSESEVKEADYYRLERAYGSFHRRLPIPFEVKPEQVKANYKDGVLEIQIPKPAQPAPEPKKITIS
jgi:HSP20 family protein